MIVSPPHASGTRSCSASCCITRFGSALSRSILLMATTIGTSAALACWIASSVWGMTPSSAATTRITMSVASAPRARMAVNAAWPGVSMKVSALPSLVDLVGTDVLGDATGLAGHDVGVADVVEELGLAVVDVTHDGDDRRAAGKVRGVLVLLGQVEHLLELDLLLLTGIDHGDLGAHLGGEQLDHVVGQRLGGGDHLALLHEEAHDIGRSAVELRAEVLGRGSPLDDDDTLGHRCIGRGVGGNVHRLELFAVATTTTLATRRTRTAARDGRDRAGIHRGHHRDVRRADRRGHRRAAAGAAAGTGRRRATTGAGTGPRARRGGLAASEAGRRGDRLARRRAWRAGRRGDRLAGRATWARPRARPPPARRAASPRGLLRGRGLAHRAPAGRAAAALRTQRGAWGAAGAAGSAGRPTGRGAGRSLGLRERAGAVRWPAWTRPPCAPWAPPRGSPCPLRRRTRPQAGHPLLRCPHRARRPAAARRVPPPQVHPAAGASAAGASAAGASAAGASRQESAAGASVAGARARRPLPAPRRRRAPRRPQPSSWPGPSSPAAFFLAGAFLPPPSSWPGAFFGSSGCSSRVRPSRMALRRTWSAYASSSEEEWLLTA